MSMSMGMGMVYGEAIARRVGPVAGSRDRRREKSWIALDKLRKESRIENILGKKINSWLSKCREFLGIFRYLAASKGLKR